MRLLTRIAAATVLAVSALTGSVFTAMAAPRTNIPFNQSFNLIEHAQYHYCINSTGARNGAGVELYQCLNANSEKWAIQAAPYGHGYIEIKNVNGYCLADTADSTLAGEPTEMYNCSAITTVMKKAEAWTTYQIVLNHISYVVFLNSNGAVCLNDFLNRNFNGNDIVVARCVNNYSEAWI